MAAAITQVSRNDKPVAAVIARPAEYNNPGPANFSQLIANQDRAIAPGVLHQHHPRDSDFLYSPPVKRPHLIGTHHNAFFRISVFVHILRLQFDNSRYQLPA
jgi:hypothetical protein